MALQVGIVGLPNVGKSTLFKALTNNPVDINNYPFCTIEPNVGVVEVPDERLKELAKMSQTQKIIPTVVEFVDIAGLVKGASEGEGLGNKFLTNIRGVDAIAQVVRVFNNGDITHVHNSIDPVRDIEVIETELMLADMVTVDKTIMRLEKLVRSEDKDAVSQMELVQKIKTALDDGVLARTIKIDFTHEPSKNIIMEMSLLTMKPIMYIYNVSNTEEKLGDELEQGPHVKLDIKIEEELMEMSANDADEMGMESHLNDVIVEAFDLLGLQTFLTTGEAETRAWTIKRGSTAPEAGAAIHNDFKDQFIRADVVNWQKLLDAGSWSAARDSGELQTVGKDYIMQDGDVVEFKV
ncbi:MAG: redox-regulated ATPase YchF [Patescibacteria group bacterium]|nr:redox-regulated ATPase YchF [Patescibacteria group bacterium]